MTTEFAAAIVDWRDTDEEMTENGAESDSYLMNAPIYNCKNAPFETVGELRLVKGGEWNILYGEDANLNSYLDQNEDDGMTNPPEDNRNGILEPGILEYVTIYSKEPNKSADGTQRINVTETDQSQLETLLQDKLGSSRASEIQQNISSGSTLRSVLEFYLRTKMTQDEFSQIADYVTDTTEEFLKGRVNVNTAGTAVLTSIPGIGKDFASRLVDYRKGKTDELKTVAWVTNILDETNSLLAGPYLTTKTYQFTADVAAVGHNGKGFRRTQFVFDLSSGAPVVVFRQDLSRLGWPLGSVVRDSLAINTGKRGRL